MGRAKRVRSVVLSASVAAMSAATACPTTNAAVAHKHVRRHRSTLPATPPRGAQVYEVTVESSTEGRPNMTCAGPSARITGVAFTDVEGANSFQLWARNPAAWNKAYSFTASPTITVSWTPPAERREAEQEANANHGEVRNPRLQGENVTTTVAALCAATSAGAGVAELLRAEVTWRLPAYARSLAAFTTTTPTSIKPIEYTDDFEVLPGGSVPPFPPFNS